MSEFAWDYFATLIKRITTFKFESNVIRINSNVSKMYVFCKLCYIVPALITYNILMEYKRFISSEKVRKMWRRIIFIIIDFESIFVVYSACQ